MTSPTTKAVQGSKFTTKGIFIILVVSIVGSIIGIALTNNSDKLQDLTAYRGFSLFSPSSWF